MEGRLVGYTGPTRDGLWMVVRHHRFVHIQTTSFSSLRSPHFPLTPCPTGPSLVQMFIPTFAPLTTGNPACKTLSSPLPCSSKFAQKMAFPSTGRNVTPLSHSSSQSTMPSSHHHPSVGASTRGKLVPPPSVPSLTCTYAKNDVTRFPPTSGAAFAGEVNQSV